VILATPGGARPAWMAQKYPEVLRMVKNRGRNLSCYRHNHRLALPVIPEDMRKEISAWEKVIAEMARPPSKPKIRNPQN
jgi:beta-galactosidase GanA